MDDLVRCAWPEAPSEILQSHELVMAIDAPLGFPVAFSELLAGRSTPSVDPRNAEIDNPLAYRETDRPIYRTFGKKPLSASHGSGVSPVLRLARSSRNAALAERQWYRETRSWETSPHSPGQWRTKKSLTTRRDIACLQGPENAQEICRN